MKRNILRRKKSTKLSESTRVKTSKILSLKVFLLLLSFGKTQVQPVKMKFNEMSIDFFFRFKSPKAYSGATARYSTEVFS